MHRRTIYPGQVPLETDLLSAQQYAMTGLAEFCSTVLGTPTLVDSFQCTPTVPASLNIVLTAGNIYQIENLEQSAWSSLPADTAHSIMKQGILLDAVTMGVTPPTTFGFSQVFLLEVQYADVDTGATVLPYYNAADPQVPFAGPGNAGAAQNTIRQGQVAFQLKAGVAASTGTQVAPTPDAGWTGLYYITVASGATTITAGNITILPTAPYLATLGHLPQIPNGVQNWQWSYCADTGTTNAWVGTVAPIPLGLTPGLSVRVKVKNAVTGATTFNLNGLGAVAVNRANGSALQSGDVNANMVADLVYDGTAWQLVNFEGFTSTTTNNNTFTLTIPYCVDTGTANNIVAPFSPAIVSVSAGNPIEVKIANTNTGATTIAVNAIAAAPVVDLFGNPLQAGMVQAGEIAFMIYTGTAWQLVNHASGGGGGIVNIQVITASGNYTPSAGATKALVFATGAGGSGCISCGGGGGGGAGATAVALVPLTGISSVACVIGAGGSAVNGQQLNGNAGGSTSFGAFAVAGGGAGALDAAENTGSLTPTPGIQLGIGGAGGTATAGVFQLVGGDGASSFHGQNGATDTANGSGGASFWGGGGSGHWDTQTGQPGRAYGAGGGGVNDSGVNGAGENVTSGAGAQGVILVLEF